MEVPAGAEGAPYPRTREQLRLWRYWERQDFWPIHLWPWHMQRMAMHHLSYPTRLYMWLFLTGNGLDPESSVEYILGSGSYDAEAVRQLRGLAANPIKYLDAYGYWDIQLGRPLRSHRTEPPNYTLA